MAIPSPCPAASLILDAMGTEANRDYRMAHGVLHGFKVVITGVAALVLLFALFTVWREALNDQSGAAVVAQGLVGTLVSALGIGVAWAILMLPVWLLSGFTAGRA